MLKPFIPLDVHILFDYIGGVVFVAMPYLAGFSHVTVARYVFLIMGVFLVCYSMFTDYYYALVRLIPLRIHIVLDVLGGLLIAVAPFLFRYHQALTAVQLGVHFMFGLGVVALVAMTDYSKLTKYTRPSPHA